MSEQDEQERIATLAEQVKNLLMFSALMVDDLDLLERVANLSDDVSSRTMAMAPIFGAVGLDFDEKHMEAEVHRKRAQAILNLVKVIKETEDERSAFKVDQAAKLEARDKIAGVLGL